VCTRELLRNIAASAFLLTIYCLPAKAQTTEDAIKARLVGQPLYLRGLWTDDHLTFNADGQPADILHSGPFTEAGIEVNKIKLSHGLLHIEGQRVGLEFLNAAPGVANAVPTRVRLSALHHHGSISIEIQSPPDGDFSKALDSIFAPDIASLIPAMPSYWQNYAQEHFLEKATKDVSRPQTASANKLRPDGSDKSFHVGGAVTPPVVLNQDEAKFSDAARALKFSGMVMVYLWVMPDGTVSHLRIVRPAGLGLDEQALSAVSKYRFKPATLLDKPVTVDLYVEVNFQIR
jgi:TonB family protein